MICSVRGCKRPVQAHGLCNAHNMRRANGWDTDSPIRKIRRLSDDEARQVRSRYVARDAPRIVELAERYGVSRVTVWRALHGLAHRPKDDLQDRIEERALDNLHPAAPRKRAIR